MQGQGPRANPSGAPNWSVREPHPCALPTRWSYWRGSASQGQTRFRAFPDGTWNSHFNEHHVPGNPQSFRMPFTLRLARQILRDRAREQSGSLPLPLPLNSTPLNPAGAGAPQMGASEAKKDLAHSEVSSREKNIFSVASQVMINTKSGMLVNSQSTPFWKKPLNIQEMESTGS